MSEFSKVESISNQNIKTVVTSDQIKFNADFDVLLQSKMIAVMLDDDVDEDDDSEIPLPNVDSKNFEKILEFLNYCKIEPLKEIEKPLRSNNLKDIVGEWYANFIDIEEEFLFSIIMAANYLDIETLVNLGCAKVASMIKGKSPEEIRKIFDIDDSSDKNDNENKNDNESKNDEH